MRKIVVFKDGSYNFEIGADATYTEAIFENEENSVLVVIPSPSEEEWENMIQEYKNRGSK